MRLLHTETKKLYEFIDTQIPRYAILSHTWGENEVTFQDLQGSPLTYEAKDGWRKIRGFCYQAARRDYEYVWVDTCCIDKSSSAELSEAINSMFAWYRNSQHCFVYLFDVPSPGNFEAAGSAFRASRWFTRGWTLQELLAPSWITFYDSKWAHIGSLFSWEDRIAGTISEITGIDERYLPSGSRHQLDIAQASIAERMSWAAERQTTRSEDMAYCLLGLFNVNMPMLYGEGHKAFTRLQAEIVKASGDQSFLASGYGMALERVERLECIPIFASSPRDFYYCGGVRDLPWGPDDELSPFEMTNLGLRIELHTIRDKGTTIALLRSGVEGKRIGLPLSKSNVGNNGYQRPAYCRPALISEAMVSHASPEKLYIQDSFPGQVGDRSDYDVAVEFSRKFTRDFDLVESYPPRSMVHCEFSAGRCHLLLDDGAMLYFQSLVRGDDARLVLRIEPLPRTDDDDAVSIDSEAWSPTYIPPAVQQSRTLYPLNFKLAYFVGSSRSPLSPAAQDAQDFTLMEHVARTVTVPSYQDPLQWSEAVSFGGKKIHAQYTSNHRRNLYNLKIIQDKIAEPMEMDVVDMPNVYSNTLRMVQAPVPDNAEETPGLKLNIESVHSITERLEEQPREPVEEEARDEAQPVSKDENNQESLIWALFREAKKNNGLKPNYIKHTPKRPDHPYRVQKR